MVEDAYINLKNQLIQSKTNVITFKELLGLKFRKRLLMAIVSSSSEALSGL